jgi:hypothetical protein
MATMDDVRHAKQTVEDGIAKLEEAKALGTGYDIAQSSQAYRKALDQAIKWAKKARSAM